MESLLLWTRTNTYKNSAQLATVQSQIPLWFRQHCGESPALKHLSSGLSVGQSHRQLLGTTGGFPVHRQSAKDGAGTK